jgi:hypothetical protein
MFPEAAYSGWSSQGVKSGPGEMQTHGSNKRFEDGGSLDPDEKQSTSRARVWAFRCSVEASTYFYGSGGDKVDIDSAGEVMCAWRLVVHVICEY